MNYYEFWNDASTQDNITTTVQNLWNDVIKPKWAGGPDCRSSCLFVYSLILTTSRHI